MARLNPQHMDAVCFVAESNRTPLGAAFLYGYQAEKKGADRVPAMTRHV